ncbi:MAG: aspartate aminotransferase family protein [Candidatus Altiarchaeota archaeon]
MGSKPKTYRHGDPYALWNPFADMDYFTESLGRDFGLMVEGRGCFVRDDSGSEYIDCGESFGAMLLGYGREELVQAASEQMRRLPFFPIYSMPNYPALEFANKLSDLAPGKLEKVLLTHSGSESVEAALKIARQYFRQSPEIQDRNRHKFISLERSYHGSFFGSMSATGMKPGYGVYGPLVPGFVNIQPPYCYRCPFGKEYPGCDVECALQLESAINSEGPETVAGFILEPILNVGGIIVPPDEYFRIVSETVKKYGILLILDEVMTGFGRTGSMFAAEHWSLEPDIMALGKGISSGYLPLGACIATSDVFSRFTGDPELKLLHGTTASGHPVCSAVGLKNIQIIEDEGLVENSKTVGSYMFKRLNELKEQHGIIGDVRGKGSMIGLELVHDRKTKKPFSDAQTFGLARFCYHLGLLVNCFQNVIRLYPPLVFTQDLADRSIEIINVALSEKPADVLKKRVGRKIKHIKLKFR